MRRSRFLARSAAGLCVAAVGRTPFGVALAAPASSASAPSDRVLVIVNLDGGNDGLNTIVPHGMPTYYGVRPTLGVPASDVLAIDANVGFHPVLRSLKNLFDARKVAVVQGVGYPAPDHSHFRSTAIWQTAAPETNATTGWVGRYIDGAGLPDANLFNAVAISTALPAIMIGGHDVPAISDLGAYRLGSDANVRERSAFADLAKDVAPFSSPYLPLVAAIADHAQRGSQELPSLLAGYENLGAYPATQLGRSLALAAQIIGSKLGTRVIYVQQSSYDTHVLQAPTHEGLLQELSDAIKAFTDDLAAHGDGDRVLTMTFSEFGRRVAENGGRGTDHGEAAPMFLIGNGVRGGLYGEHPSLDDLDDGDMKFTVDFRNVYATVIERWIGRPSAAILGGNFPKLAFL